MALLVNVWILLGQVKHPRRRDEKNENEEEEEEILAAGLSLRSLSLPPSFLSCSFPGLPLFPPCGVSSTAFHPWQSSVKQHINDVAHSFAVVTDDLSNVLMQLFVPLVHYSSLPPFLPPPLLLHSAHPPPLIFHSPSSSQPSILPSFTPPSSLLCCILLHFSFWLTHISRRQNMAAVFVPPFPPSLLTRPSPPPLSTSLNHESTPPCFLQTTPHFLGTRAKSSSHPPSPLCFLPSWRHLLHT